YQNRWHTLRPFYSQHALLQWAHPRRDAGRLKPRTLILAVMNGRGKIWTWFTPPLRWAAALVALVLLLASLLWLPAIRKRLGDNTAVKVTPPLALPSPSTSLLQPPLSPTPFVHSSEGSSTSNTPLTFTLIPGNVRQGQSVRTIIRLSGEGDKIRLNLAMEAD